MLKKAVFRLISFKFVFEMCFEKKDGLKQMSRVCFYFHFIFVFEMCFEKKDGLKQMSRVCFYFHFIFVLKCV